MRSPCFHGLQGWLLWRSQGDRRCWFLFWASIGFARSLANGSFYDCLLRLNICARHWEASPPSAWFSISSVRPVITQVSAANTPTPDYLTIYHREHISSLSCTAGRGTSTRRPTHPKAYLLFWILHSSLESVAAASALACQGGPRRSAVMPSYRGLYLLTSSFVACAHCFYPGHNSSYIFCRALPAPATSLDVFLSASGQPTEYAASVLLKSCRRPSPSPCGFPLFGSSASRRKKPGLSGPFEGLPPGHLNAPGILAEVYTNAKISPVLKTIDDSVSGSLPLNAFHCAKVSPDMNSSPSATPSNPSRRNPKYRSIPSP